MNAGFTQTPLEGSGRLHNPVEQRDVIGVFSRSFEAVNPRLSTVHRNEAETQTVLTIGSCRETFTALIGRPACPMRSRWLQSSFTAAGAMRDAGERQMNITAISYQMEQINNRTSGRTQTSLFPSECSRVFSLRGSPQRGLTVPIGCVALPSLAHSSGTTAAHRLCIIDATLRDWH